MAELIHYSLLASLSFVFVLLLLLRLDSAIQGNTLLFFSKTYFFIN